jgi:hypothetical protein
MQGAAAMSPWLVLVDSLGKRPPKTADEINDEINCKKKRERYASVREGRARQAVRKMAETEAMLLETVRNHPGSTYLDIASAIGLTEHHIREVAKRMYEDRRLSMKVGSFGKKYWYANEY